jgi:hypothetical protein
MTSAQVPATTSIRAWKWSSAEKIIARRAFEMALNRELETVIREAKERADRIKEAPDLWEMEGWLTEQRERIDRTFEFRYSVLPLVFATLLSDCRLSDDDLHGLAQEKLDTIHRMVRT